MVKYVGPDTFPEACSPPNSTNCPSPMNYDVFTPRFAAGFRSVQCRCDQDPIVCQPSDEWVLIAQYNNKLDVATKFQYTKVENVPWKLNNRIVYKFGRYNLTTQFFMHLQFLLGNWNDLVPRSIGIVWNWCDHWSQHECIFFWYGGSESYGLWVNWIPLGISVKHSKESSRKFRDIRKGSEQWVLILWFIHEYDSSIKILV